MPPAKRNRREERRKEKIHQRNRNSANEQEIVRASFGQQIETAMLVKKVSRADLARRMHRSRAHITHVLDRKGNLTIRTMVQLAKALGMEVRVEVAPPHDDDEGVRL